jgi:hypothetical protein
MNSRRDCHCSSLLVFLLEPLEVYLRTVLGRWLVLVATVDGDGKHLPIITWALFDTQADESRIFIIEGLMTVVIGVAAKFMVVDWPETAKFLNGDERALLVARLALDAGDARMNRLDKQAAKRVFGDWKIYCGIVMYMGVVNTGYATSFFTPTIIKQLGFTSAAAQVRSIPIFIVATCCSLLTAWATDRLRHRYSFTILGLCIASTGLIILLCQDHVSTGVRYMAIFLVTSGGYITQPVTIAWVNNNMGGHYKRSVAMAMMIGFGNCGGLVASNIFITNQAPR